MAAAVAGIADELKALRELAGLTRRDLAELSGVSGGAIKLIEYGESTTPRPETLRLLARGLSTNRITQTVDAGQFEDLYGRLLRAAGYVPETLDASRAAPEDIPDDIRDRVIELVGTDEGLVRAILADLTRRPDESRRAALRFMADALKFSHESAPGRTRRRPAH